MKNEYSVKDKLILWSLAVGVACFGFILPDSLSDHYRLVSPFGAFRNELFTCILFLHHLHSEDAGFQDVTYTVLIAATLFIGVFYKYWEIATCGMIGNYSFHKIIGSTGVATSMSQNISGLLGAILLIEGLVARNLVVALRHNSVKSERNLMDSSAN